MALPHRLAVFNRRVTNHLARLVAGHVPGLGIVVHRGRKSGRTYRTPVMVFRAEDGFTIVLAYGRSDWVHNVEAAGGATIETRGRSHPATDPQIVDAPDHPDLPAPVRAILRRLDTDEEMHLKA